MTVPAIVSNEVAAEITARVNTKKADIESAIARYERYIESERVKLTKVEEATTNFFAVKARLQAASFDVKVSTWAETLEVSVDRTQLTEVYKLIGRLNGEYASKEIVDPRNRLIRVSLPSVRHPFVSVVYQTKLPKNAKCKIETIKYKARTEKILVCEC